MYMDSRTPLTILLADDNQFFARAVKRFLEGILGTTVIGHARNGIEALSMARDLNPALILLDIAMPELDGLEVAREIQRWEQPPLIVFLSLNDNPAYRDAARTLGAVAFVNKADFVEKLPPVITRLADPGPV